MTPTYYAPALTIVSIRPIAVLAFSEPRAGIDRSATSVTGDQLDVKSQGTHDVWSDDWR